MRIGYVLKRFPRVSETFIAQEILELERQGVEVVVFTLRSTDAPARHEWLSTLRAEIVPCEGWHMSRTWKDLHRRAQEPAGGARPEEALELAFGYPTTRGRHHLAEAVALAEAFEERGLQHLHAHFANHPAFVALLVHLVTGCPFSFTAHAKDIYVEGPPDWLWRRQLEEAAFAVTVSEDNARHLASRLGKVAASRLLTIYNGVDLERIRPRSGPPPGAPTVLCIARLVEKKGIDVLLEAAAIHAREGGRARFAIAGAGPERTALEARAAELGVGSRVRFLGAVHHGEILEWLGRSALLALPCRVAADGDQDALPTVLLEAMAAGLPCISTPVGGVPEIVEHRKTGLLVPPESPWALAKALDALLTDPEARSAMGAAGRRRAEGRFDLRRNVEILRRWMDRSCRGALRRAGATDRAVGE